MLVLQSLLGDVKPIMPVLSSRGLVKRIEDWTKTPRIRELRFTLYLMRQSPLVMFGIAIGLTMALLGFLAPWIAPYGEQYRNWSLVPLVQPPSSTYILGTDQWGGDIFSRILWGLRLDLVSALMVVLVAALIGIVIGALAGFLGGISDEVLMRITDIFLAFPALILAMAVAAAFGRNWNNLMVALTIVWWPSYARLIRGQVLVEKEKLYVEAARAVGAGKMRILFRHVLPNSIFPLLVAVTLDIGGVMLTAAGLSFIGFGAPLGTAELGRMVSDGAGYLTSMPGMVAYPGIIMLLTAVGFNLIGDGLRDVWDPRLRR